MIRRTPHFALCLATPLDLRICYNNGRQFGHANPGWLMATFFVPEFLG